jgi:hypothetical protein
MKKITVFLVAAIMIGLLACSEDSNPQIEKETFTKIYDSNAFDSAYYPIDIRETADGGYLMLARKRTSGEFSGVYVLKASQTGDFVAENNFSPTLVNPVGTLMPKGDAFIFFAMNETTKLTQLVTVDATGATTSVVGINASYPSAAAADGNEFVLLGYDHVNRVTTLNVVNTAGDIVSSATFSVGVGGEDQVEEDMINSFFQYGRKLPFIAGRIPGGLYYFNGFYNYTFSLVFTDLTSEDPAGLIQGQHNDGGFSAALPLGGNRFAASVFNFGDNYILPNKTLTISAGSPDAAVDLGGFTLPELVPNANIRILKATIDNKETLVFAGDTKSKQIGLWFYDVATGELLSSRYLGFSNPFEIGNLIQTSDEGLAVCGTTYIAGRFARICMFKLSKSDLSHQVK